MTLFPATGPQAGISAPSSRRGQTEAAIGHLRFEGDMGRELPRSIWEAAGRGEEEGEDGEKKEIGRAGAPPSAAAPSAGRNRNAGRKQSEQEWRSCLFQAQILPGLPSGPCLWACAWSTTAGNLKKENQGGFPGCSDSKKEN